MGNSDTENRVECGGGCHHCSQPLPDATEGPRGWRLVLPTIGVFLVPLILAMAGAVMAGRNRTSEFFGATAGLLIGLIAAAGISHWVRCRGKEAS